MLRNPLSPAKTFDMRDFRRLREAGCNVKSAGSGARALHEAFRRGWEFSWQIDEYTPASDVFCTCCDFKAYARENPCEVWYVAILDEEGELLDSLGGILDPDDTYRRFLEAELAENALAYAAKEEAEAANVAFAQFAEVC